MFIFLITKVWVKNWIYSTYNLWPYIWIYLVVSDLIIHVFGLEKRLSVESIFRVIPKGIQAQFLFYVYLYGKCALVNFSKQPNKKHVKQIKFPNQIFPTCVDFCSLILFFVHIICGFSLKKINIEKINLKIYVSDFYYTLKFNRTYK